MNRISRSKKGTQFKYRRDREIDRYTRKAYKMQQKLYKASKLYKYG